MTTLKFHVTLPSGVEVDLNRLISCLKACEGTTTELLGPGIVQILRQHIAAQHESFRKHAGLPMRLDEVTSALKKVMVELNCRGELDVGGYDYNTGVSDAYHHAKYILDKDS